MPIESGSCSLIIRGQDELKFDLIAENILLHPSRIIKKGEIIYRSAGKVKSDVWIYEIKMNNGEQPNDVLELLLNNLKPYLRFIKTLTQTTDICIRCYIQSDLAQIGFDFLPEAIRKLAEFGIKLEISILSWGKVEMDDDACK